jgi:hypothetical protein
MSSLGRSADRSDEPDHHRSLRPLAMDGVVFVNSQVEDNHAVGRISDEHGHTHQPRRLGRIIEGIQALQPAECIDPKTQAAILFDNSGNSVATDGIQQSSGD